MADLLQSGWEENEVTDGGLWDDTNAGAASVVEEPNTGYYSLLFTLTGTSVEYVMPTTAWGTSDAYVSLAVKFSFREGIEDLDGGTVEVVAFWETVGESAPLYVTAEFSASDYQFKFYDSTNTLQGTSAACDYDTWYEIRLSSTRSSNPYLNEGYVNGSLVATVESSVKAETLFIGGLTMVACTGSQHVDSVYIDSTAFPTAPAGEAKAAVTWGTETITATKLNAMVQDHLRSGRLVWQSFGYRNRRFHAVDGHTIGLEDDDPYTYIGQFWLNPYQLPYDTLAFEGFCMANPYEPAGPIGEEADLELSFDYGNSWLSVGEVAYSDYGNGSVMSGAFQWSRGYPAVTNGTTSQTRFRINLRTGQWIFGSTTQDWGLGVKDANTCSLRIHYVGTPSNGTSGANYIDTTMIQWNYRVFLYHSSYNFGMDAPRATS